MIIEFSFLYSSSLLAFIIGIAATVLTRYSSIPQIIKGFKTKKMDDVSFWLIFYLTVGLFLYVIYGIIIDDAIIIWGNAIGVISNLLLIILKIKYSVKSFE
jgi:MtN3 and saliva related transmembrane protein